MAAIQVPSILFTPGRACAGPLAVVLHEFGSGLESLDARMGSCPRRRPAQSPGCHTSFHYGVSGDGFHQYVDQGDTAWGFGLTPPTCPEPVCPPDPCASCTGITVDQYQTDLDGNPPTIPAWAAGPDGTVNCAVIHVALPGINSGSDPDCCRFLQNPHAYQALVRALCQIFAEAGLTPSQDTLLVHCGELVCLDIDQLVEDVLAFDCAVVPVTPCINCPPVAGTLTVTDTDTVDLTLLLANLSADVIVSPDAGNIIVAQANGLYATAAAGLAPACSALLPINSVVYGTPAAGGAPDFGLVQRPQLSVVQVPNTGSIDPASDDDVFVYSGVGVGTVTLVAPLAGACSVNDVWIKNLSADALNVQSAALIDGQATITLDGTVPAGYPFGNNGGEAVHLVYDFVAATWYVL